MKKLAAAFVLALVTSPVFAQDAKMAEKLGDAYSKAEGPAAKLAAICLADTTKKFKDYKERKIIQPTIDEIYMGVISQGKTSKEKLELLGSLRKETAELCKTITKERREAKEKQYYVNAKEPSSNLQTALAMSYVFDTAGPTPTIAKLACLKTVRDNTSWFGNGTLVLSYVTDALTREEAYKNADHKGKLAIIAKLTNEGECLSSQEQKYLDKAVLSDWMSVQLKEGKSAGDILIAVKGMAKEKLICFFTSSWAEGVLTELAKVR